MGVAPGYFSATGSSRWLRHWPGVFVRRTNKERPYFLVRENLYAIQPWKGITWGRFVDLLSHAGRWTIGYCKGWAFWSELGRQKAPRVVAVSGRARLAMSKTDNRLLVQAPARTEGGRLWAGKDCRRSEGLPFRAPVPITVHQRVTLCFSSIPTMQRDSNARRMEKH